MAMHLQPLRAAAVDVTASAQPSTDLARAKQELLSWVAGTKRGSNTTKLLRGQIEEAQVHMSQTHDMRASVAGTQPLVDRSSQPRVLLHLHRCPAQVSVEAFSPAELDYGLLEGKWLLHYTDALDVVRRHARSSCSRLSEFVGDSA